MHGNPSTAQTDHEPDGLPVPQRYYAVIAVWFTVAMAVIDSTVVNIALPTIATELSASPETVVWVINAYQLVIAMLLLPFAAMADRVGHSRVYLGGMVLFIIGSLACALAGSLQSLIAARMLQGIGAAGIMSANTALIRAIYPASMLGRGLGYNALVLSASSALGPTLASAILSMASWHWLFAINVPFGLAALALGIPCLPHRKGHGRQPDYVAAVLSAGMLGFTIFGAETFAREGSNWGLGMAATGIILGAILVRREWNEPAPLIPLDLLRRPIIGLSVLTSMLSFSAVMVMMVTMPFLLQKELGRGVMETGFILTSFPVALGFAAGIAGRFADRMPAGLMGGVGLIMCAIGLLALALLGPGPALLDIIWPIALCGAGFGIFQPPNNRAMIGSAPRERSGAAGGMLASARLLGQTIGAVSVALGFHWLGFASTPVMLGIAAGVAALAACVSMMRLRVPQPPSEPGSAIADVS